MDANMTPNAKWAHHVDFDNHDSHRTHIVFFIYFYSFCDLYLKQSLLLFIWFRDLIVYFLFACDIDLPTRFNLGLIVMFSH
jgi:hypothetical protein